MRSRTLSIIALAGLLTLVLAVGSALAQVSATLRADIPFQFAAGSVTLPAGEYTVQTTAFSHVLAIANAAGGAKALVLTNGLETTRVPAESRLVFRKYGDRYFLSQIWTQGETRGSTLPVSKTERELTQRASHYQVVAVLAKR